MAIDPVSQAITIVDRKDYVIDSIILTGHAKTYLCKGLVVKDRGSSRILLRSNTPDYEIYADSMSTLVCLDRSLNLDIILRKRGDTTKVTVEIANGYKHVPQIYTVSGVKLVPCSKYIDTVWTDKQKF